MNSEVKKAVNSVIKKNFGAMFLQVGNLIYWLKDHHKELNKFDAEQNCKRILIGKGRLPERIKYISNEIR